ncbi:hypothetical protein L226DRAFT_573347 [Lentinus tigrinus ALCF2SS1-7]|uniref:uncharacterized protein n=1 Tax=Lentinus tigrinus ALCF2SS1-7 TaxID=1328758 RepID=UPI001165FE92|nr:hypothetical protein L226DRAFT_573347 [Lentinus tigrinus ALCF2SS1-7]
MLREQVRRLQKRVATLEDDIHRGHPRDERARGCRSARPYQAVQGAGDGRKETDLVRKSEESACFCIEELEKTIREKTVALENARAELLTLTGCGRHERLFRQAQRADSAGERARFQEEIAELKQHLAQSKAQSSGGNVRPLEDKLHSHQEDLRETAELADERAIVEDLRALADEHTPKLDTIRKNLLNREGSVNGNELKMPAAPSSQHDLSVARDEITGLKSAYSSLCLQVLESESKLSFSETEQLRKLKVLEEDVERSLARKERRELAVDACNAFIGWHSGAAAQSQEFQGQIRGTEVTRVADLEMKSGTLSVNFSALIYLISLIATGEEAEEPFVHSLDLDLFYRAIVHADIERTSELSTSACITTVRVHIEAVRASAAVN